ncbi:hypothetical protein SAMN05421780_11038 [Flexibacter flexilis DSM 6793]|uniref:Uncharacterized protein n=1 Tax=Flexibacter flexilis DSM 6793 TaxID=927664 RepID=A0A1I1M5D8_9BACT|nr:hypothetical protein [Flexibacter flexilis]SFC80649.1 hypothetical protein SAMN05421780_11038 [Flexibacter flexilis DSM 6793]
MKKILIGGIVLLGIAAALTASAAAKNSNQYDEITSNSSGGMYVSDNFFVNWAWDTNRKLFGFSLVQRMPNGELNNQKGATIEWGNSTSMNSNDNQYILIVQSVDDGMYLNLRRQDGDKLIDVSKVLAKKGQPQPEIIQSK